MSLGSPVHVIPLGDLVPHRESHRCWCLPAVENRGSGPLLLIHHAADEREYWERRTDLLKTEAGSLNFTHFSGPQAH